MLDALDITEAEAAGLTRLAALDLAMAEHFAERAQTADDPEVASQLARNYQRAARSYRQTLALKARLKRDLAQAARAAGAAPPARPGGLAVARRIRELRTALIRVAWDEVERDDAERDEESFAWYVPDIEAAIAEECRGDSFGAEALDDHVARLCLAFGFAPEAAERWRDLPDPPDAALLRATEPIEPSFRSSA